MPLYHYVFEDILALGLAEHHVQTLGKNCQSIGPPHRTRQCLAQNFGAGLCSRPQCGADGGIWGSAGIFSNAEDLAVIFHTPLKVGSMAASQLFERNTVDDSLTTKSSTNHRGLGFDKPTKRRYPTYSPHASSKSFGHTGFTGTCVWVDPEQRLVYVFLSNRGLTELLQWQNLYGGHSQPESMRWFTALLAVLTAVFQKLKLKKRCWKWRKALEVSLKKT